MHQDGHDFVPSKKGLVFGHHFTSIAGTGPIVGPAIGVIWGWLPALIWVVFGSIFMGAVHDLGGLGGILRHDGRSICDIANDLVSKRVQQLVFFIVCLALWIVIAIFGLVIAIIFHLFLNPLWPVWAEIPIAIAFGFFVRRYPSQFKLISALAILAMCGGGGWALVPHYHAVGVWHASYRDLDSVVACLCLQRQYCRFKHCCNPGII